MHVAALGSGPHEGEFAAVHETQSKRPLRNWQVPFALSQNWLAGQLPLSRQNGRQAPFTHASRGSAVTEPSVTAQSLSARQPTSQRSVWLLQIEFAAQCSSSVQGPFGMQRFLVVSQKLNSGQSRFEVQEASAWHRPSPLQKLSAGQPVLSLHLQPPETASHVWFAGHVASEAQTHRSVPSVAFRNPGGQHASVTHTQAPTDGL